MTGASSGIGAAFAVAAPTGDSRVIGIARRPSQAMESLCADLSDPASWELVAAGFRDTLADGGFDEAVLFHCAGTIAATGSLYAIDPAEYTRSVLLNSASGQVLGRAFLAAAAAAGCAATLVMCSSPGATDALSGMSHYCGGKAGLEHWTRAVAKEVGNGAGAPPHLLGRALCR